MFSDETKLTSYEIKHTENESTKLKRSSSTCRLIASAGILELYQSIFCRSRVKFLISTTSNSQDLIYKFSHDLYIWISKILLSYQDLLYCSISRFIKKFQLLKMKTINRPKFNVLYFSLLKPFLRSDCTEKAFINTERVYGNFILLKVTYKLFKSFKIKLKGLQSISTSKIVSGLWNHKNNLISLTEILSNRIVSLRMNLSKNNSNP